MDTQDDVLDYARMLDQAGMLDPRMLVERADGNERVIREAADRNLEAYFFDGARISDSRCPAIATALDSALRLIMEKDLASGVSPWSSDDGSGQ